MATQVRCPNCRTWFPKFTECEGCGFSGHGFNKWLRTAQLNGHLFDTQNRVSRERTDQAHFVKQAKIEQARVANR